MPVGEFISYNCVYMLFHLHYFPIYIYIAIMSHMDNSIGAVVKTLEQENMLKDSIIIFSTDNGGPAEGFNLNAASNWPMRGVKNTLWEGGVRGAALLWSPLLEKPSRIANQTMHISDWLPTLYNIAGGNLELIIFVLIYIFSISISITYKIFNNLLYTVIWYRISMPQMYGMHYLVTFHQIVMKYCITLTIYGEVLQLQLVNGK